MLCAHNYYTYSIQYYNQVGEQINCSFYQQTHENLWFCCSHNHYLRSYKNLYFYLSHDHFMHKLYNTMLYDQNYCKKNNSQERDFGTGLSKAFLVEQLFRTHSCCSWENNQVSVGHHFLSYCCFMLNFLLKQLIRLAFFYV
jgi:hypothetical protein